MSGEITPTKLSHRVDVFAGVKQREFILSCWARCNNLNIREFERAIFVQQLKRSLQSLRLEWMLWAVAKLPDIGGGEEDGLAHILDF